MGPLGNTSQNEWSLQIFACSPWKPFSSVAAKKKKKNNVLTGVSVVTKFKRDQTASLHWSFWQLGKEARGTGVFHLVCVLKLTVIFACIIGLKNSHCSVCCWKVATFAYRQASDYPHMNVVKYVLFQAESVCLIF